MFLYTAIIQVEELPDDLLEFHEAVNSLQQQEEDVVEEHRELIGVRRTDFMRFMAIN